MLAKEILERKRDGCEITGDEIRFIVRGVTDGSIPDYQISAWLMAVVCRGMTETETAVLTECMLDSGRRLQPCSSRPRVDKHSTGGLGDKTSLILAPLLACFDLDVPMLSGRGLGITGGTLDKLEAYPGYRCDLRQDEIDRQLNQIGCVITGTTPDIAPADRRLYALRDVTGTVPSVGLITGSIMSKKLAESLNALVLDVKWGSGAFMQTLTGARELERSLVRTGQRMGVAMSSLITDMNQPLGRMVGNACEVNEAVEVLRGQGPADVLEVTLALAAKLLIATGRADSESNARKLLEQSLAQGKPLDRYRAMIEAQGGEFKDQLPTGKPTEVVADSDGWISAVSGRDLGNAIIAMGGGRRQQGDAIDHRAGIEMLVRIGDCVERGQPLLRVLFEGPTDQRKAIADQVRASISMGLERPEVPKLIV